MKINSYDLKIFSVMAIIIFTKILKDWKSSESAGNPGDFISRRSQEPHLHIVWFLKMLR